MINNTRNEVNIKIDKKILPLFSLPLQLKQINDQKRNKYNINTTDTKSTYNYNIITLNQILDLYLKGITLYNYNLNNYLLKRNKLELILQLKKENNLNIRISNFFYTIQRFLPILQINSLLYNVNLFFPNRLLKPEPNIRFSHRIKYISKIFIFSNNQEETEISINKLLSQGNEIINDLDYQITLKKNIINNIKTNNLNSILNSLFKVEQPLNTINNFVAKGENLIENNNLITSTPYNSLLNKFEQKLVINRIFKSINKSNEIKIEQTINSILKNNKFVSNIDSISINSNPVSLAYSLSPQSGSQSGKGTDSIKKPIINQYLKSMSIYNMSKNGIFVFYSNIIGFNFNTLTNKLNKNIYKLLAASFKSMYCLISKPVFIITADKIIIQLFYYLFIPNILKLKKIHRFGYRRRNKLNNTNWIKRRKNITTLYRKFRKLKINVRIKLRKLSNITLSKVYPERFKKLCEILSSLLQKPVELDLIRLHYPYNDSNILVNLLGIMINKIKLRIIIRKLFEKAVLKNLNKLNTKTNKTKVNIIPAFLSGMNIKVGGRLLTHKVVPRQTVKTTRRGASAKGKINFSDVARFTNKNKRGAFTITISSGQNYF